jgi:hypothetical protein
VKDNLVYVEKIAGSIASHRSQYLVFAGLSLGALGFATILYYSNRLLFQRFLGRTNPLIPFLCAIALGFISLSWLLSQRWFVIYAKGNLSGRLGASGLAALLGIIMILVDTRIVFPAGTNVPFPASLLFYPAIGFLAEILFHMLPLTVLLAILNLILKNANPETMIWISILIASLLEPVYQTMNMASSGQFPLWAVIYVGFHVFTINLFQLLAFKRYDFISMYSFRLVYYMFWHIGWGYVRLRLLF